MIMLGDCLVVLPTLEAESVQCCITSPPYWGLRDYGCVGQLGLERTPEEYVEKMVAVFRAVRRVLKDDGTAWLNLGDCYATGAGKVGECPGGGEQGERWKGGRGMNTKQPKWATALGPICQPNRMPLHGLKPKDLVGIPWRVAFALQADGWYLRSDIIWSKPNPMPESVTDRPTKAHEYLFLLSKSERYYYDAAAIAEPVSDAMRAQMAQGYNGTATKDYESAGVQNPSSVKARILARASGKVYTAQAYGEHPQSEPRGPASNFGLPLNRNRRSVWTINTQPFPGAHFAVMPEALVEPCVKAGSKPGDVVLDPFAGAGTVGAVCERYDRRFIGIELNPAYVEMAERRIAEQVRPLLFGAAAQAQGEA
jgi:DNA modification methylase